MIKIYLLLCIFILILIYSVFSNFFVSKSIDDKMINRANREGITVKELGDRFIDEYFKDAQALGIKKATVHPKANPHPRVRYFENKR